MSRLDVNRGRWTVVWSIEQLVVESLHIFDGLEIGLVADEFSWGTSLSFYIDYLVLRVCTFPDSGHADLVMAEKV